MAKRADASRNDTPLCPHCGSDLTFVVSWTVAGLWGYKEVHTWECSTHGPLFFDAQDPMKRRASQTAGPGVDGGDRESLIPARRGPKPILKSGAIAVPEPDSD